MPTRRCSFLAPAQPHCNYITLLFRNVRRCSARATSTAPAALLIVATPAGPNNEGTPSSAPANGGTPTRDNYLHCNPYPFTASPGQPTQCESGNEPFLTGRQVIGNVPGRQPSVTEGTK